MNLRDFVAETLTQIVQGVAQSAQAISDLGGAVSPALHAGQGGERLGITSDGKQAPVYGVQFDVAVVASSADTQEAGGGLRVAGFGFGGKIGGTDKEETTSRVRFVVPLALPLDPKSSEAAERKRRETDERIRRHNQASGTSSWMGT